MEELIFSSVSTDVAVPIFRVSESGRYQVELHRSDCVRSVGEESQLGRGPSLPKQSFISHTPPTSRLIEGSRASL